MLLRFSRWFPFSIRLLGIFVCFCCAALAQNTATLTGSLSDPSGAAIPGAEITVQATPRAAGGAAFRAVSDHGGRFQMTLPPGSYRVRVVKDSFAPIEQEFTVAAKETRQLNLRLRLEPVVEATVSTPTSVITENEIAHRQAFLLSTVLAAAPGATVAQIGRGGGVASLFLNGGNSNFTKVLVDGAPVNEPGGSVDFSNFTLDNVAKVEVVRGAESALFGSDAMAGVVQIFTRRGVTHRPQLRLLAEGGRFSTGRSSAELSGLAGRFDYSLGAGYFQTGGEGVNNPFLNRTLSGNFGWRFSETSQLRLALRNNTSDAGVAGQTLFEPPNLDQHDALHNFSASAIWEFSTGAHWRHRVAASESYQRQLFDNPLSDFFPASDPFGFCDFPRSPQAVASDFCDFPFTARNQFNRAGVSAQSSYFFRRGAATAGYSYEVENGFLSSLENRHARRNNQAGFLDLRYQLWPRLILTAGVRAEANASFGTRVVPRVGAALLLREGQGFWGATRLRGSYGQGIKEPSLGQSFGADPCFPGNPGLRPEQSRTATAGIEQRLAADRVRVSADYYYNRFRDIVSFAFGQSAGSPPAFCGGFFGTFFNTDLARARGVNVEVESRPLGWLQVSGNYSYTDSRVLRSPNAFDPALIPGNRLLRRPVHSGNLVVNAAFRRMNWNLAAYFVGPRTDSDFLGLGLTRNPGYARFDLGTSYTLRRGVTLFGRAENLFDKSYQDALGYPAYGRLYRVGMKFTFGGE